MASACVRPDPPDPPGGGDSMGHCGKYRAMSGCTRVKSSTPPDPPCSCPITSASASSHRSACASTSA
eukprot:2492379-Pyramimonas_sp.AAC.1